MSKVWINPAFKDKLIDKKEEPPPPVKEEKKESKVKAQKKEEKQKTSEEKPEKKKKEKNTTDKPLQPTEEKTEAKEQAPDEEKPEKKKKEKKTTDQPLPHSNNFNELKLLQVLKQKDIPIEGMLVNGMKINGKIKWFTQFTVGLLLDDGRDIILNRLMLIYYSQPKEYSLSRKDFDEIPKFTTFNNETVELRKLKDEKAILLFHLKNGIDIRGKIDWSDYLTYHVISPDDEREYMLPKSSLLYIEEVKA